MNVQNLACASCGAPIQIPSDVEHFNCSYCGASLVVQRGEGYVTVKLVEKVTETIQSVGAQTQSTVREGNQATQAEIKKLQLNNELNSLQLQLTTVQSEIRNIERLKNTRVNREQLKKLRLQENEINKRIFNIRTILYPSTPKAIESQASKSGCFALGKLFKFAVGLVLVLLIMGCSSMVLFAIFQPLDDLISLQLKSALNLLPV